MTPQDALEFLLAGATVVGLGTGLFYDPLLCPKVNAELADYLRRHGIATVAGLTGSLRLPGTPEPTCYSC
jgi:dihydroorotate dehydrogenase (NAD+) catalytic subunit